MLKEAPKNITNLTDLSDYMKFHKISCMVGHPVWYEDDSTQENVTIKFKTSFDKEYGHMCLTWWSVGDSRGKNKVGDNDVRFEQKGKKVTMQFHQVGLKVRFTLF